MRISERELQRLAEAIVAALQKQEQVKFKGTTKAAADRIVAIFVENLRQEQAIETEAERLAEQHAKKMVGMDMRKVVMGIKERLAKEKGFAL